MMTNNIYREGDLEVEAIFQLLARPKIFGNLGQSGKENDETAATTILLKDSRFSVQKRRLIWVSGALISASRTIPEEERVVKQVRRALRNRADFLRRR